MSNLRVLPPLSRVQSEFAFAIVDHRLVVSPWEFRRLLLSADMAALLPRLQAWKLMQLELSQRRVRWFANNTDETIQRAAGRSLGGSRCLGGSALHRIHTELARFGLATDMTTEALDAWERDPQPVTEDTETQHDETT